MRSDLCPRVVLIEFSVNLKSIIQLNVISGRQTYNVMSMQRGNGSGTNILGKINEK